MNDDCMAQNEVKFMNSNHYMQYTLHGLARKLELEYEYSLLSRQVTISHSLPTKPTESESSPECHKSSFQGIEEPLSPGLDQNQKEFDPWTADMNLDGYLPNLNTNPFVGIDLPQAADYPTSMCHEPVRTTPLEFLDWGETEVNGILGVDPSLMITSHDIPSVALSHESHLSKPKSPTPKPILKAHDLPPSSQPAETSSDPGTEEERQKSLPAPREYVFESFFGSSKEGLISPGRRGPLNDIAREKSLAVKNLGSCWKCRFLRKGVNQFHHHVQASIF